jgi:hypothetical protein
MAQENGQAAVTQQEQQQQGKICYGDCFACGYQQAWMCTSMNSLRTMRLAESLIIEVQVLKAQVAELQEKFGVEPVPPIQQKDSEEEVVIENDEEETASKGKKK